MSLIKRAIISVFNKDGILEFARGLKELGVELIATEGTARFLKQNGIASTPVSELTGFGKMLGGRVKTLHPKILGALLAVRDDAQQMQELQEAGMEPIDLVVVNLYPFSQVIKQEKVQLAEALENIDIGGPTMIRAAAKNYLYVAVVTRPAQYQRVLSEMRQQQGALSLETRRWLATEAFRLTSQYDETIFQYLTKPTPKADAAFPDELHLHFIKVQDLRYGENPHQKAAWYQDSDSAEPSLGSLKQLHGKELSFNNLLDLDAALRLVGEFDGPCSVIIKHNNPCGVAVADTLIEAFQKAKATDPVSAFGGILAFNRPLDLNTAREISSLFVEVVAAPGFDSQALEILMKKKNLRLLEYIPSRLEGYDLKRVSGGLLVQEYDLKKEQESEFKVVTRRAPSEQEWAALKFGWKVVKWVRSNAIVYTTEDRTIGIGAGQMSRVDAALLAVQKAKQAGLSLKGTAVASDAFFPFKDGIEVAAEAGATAIIQPGGSIRDEEVIQAADQKGLAMVFTGVRHFRH